MTRIVQRRCRHCLVPYSFQSSGWGAARFNDARYCLTCAEAVAAALSVVPKAREVFWKDLPDAEWIIAERDRAWEARRSQVSTSKTVLGLMTWEYSPGLIGADGVYERVNVVRYGGAIFHVHEWPDGRKPTRVEVKMERDLATGREFEWRDYESG